MNDQCPCCGANSICFRFPDNQVGKFLETMVPDARECLECEFAWSPEREAVKAALEGLDFSKLTKAERFSGDHLKFKL